MSSWDSEERRALRASSASASRKRCAGAVARPSMHSSSRRRASSPEGPPVWWQHCPRTASAFLIWSRPAIGRWSTTSPCRVWQGRRSSDWPPSTRAELIITAVRTGGPGAGGISLRPIDRHLPGAEMGAPLHKMGWRCPAAAALPVRATAAAMKRSPPAGTMTPVLVHAERSPRFTRRSWQGGSA